jgi:hypothetical protein
MDCEDIFGDIGMPKLPEPAGIFSTIDCRYAKSYSGIADCRLYATNLR